MFIFISTLVINNLTNETIVVSQIEYICFDHISTQSALTLRSKRKIWDVTGIFHMLKEHLFGDVAEVV